MSVPVHARRRFQRYVALLLAITLPALAVGEMVQAPSPGASLLLSGYGVLCVWAIYVIRSKSARVVPLLLAIMFYLASLIIVETTPEGSEAIAIHSVGILATEDPGYEVEQHADVADKPAHQAADAIVIVKVKRQPVEMAE